MDPRTPPGAPPSPPNSATDSLLTSPNSVRLESEGARRGFKNPLSFKRFCLRVGIPIYKVGKMLFVKPAEVDAGIARGATRQTPSDGGEGVRRAVEQLMGRR